MADFEFDYKTAFNGLVDYLLEPFKCKNCLNYDCGVCTNTDLPVNGEDFCSMAREVNELNCEIHKE